MLELAVGQVEAAMRESNASVEVLTHSFTSMATALQAIDAAAAALPDEVGNAPVKGEIMNNAAVVSTKVHSAIVAFQFYDKLGQRLAHVCHALGQLSALVSDRERIFNPRQWVLLQEQIRSKYAMPEELAMFDAVMQGMSVEEALAHYMELRAKEVEDSGGDIELF